VKIGLLHPGAMGAAIGAAVDGEVLWASAGRSEATRTRAASFRDAGTLAALVAEADLILSICPPHAALEMARACAGFDGLYVDANAISPARAREIAALQPRFVDGGIIGGPESPALYLSGEEAAEVARLFPALETHVVPDASAVKMVFAAWTKGTAALLLAIRETAAHYGVEDEWRGAAPELGGRLARAEASAREKGWRWAGEMDEIADTFAAAGQPEGFHRAAAEVYRR
jgi:3-hydroxyisobutyrate dehydrogenase-like beta-hydroxyacid dehydrogenase